MFEGKVFSFQDVPNWNDRVQLLLDCLSNLEKPFVATEELVQKVNGFAQTAMFLKQVKTATRFCLIKHQLTGVKGDIFFDQGEIDLDFGLVNRAIDYFCLSLDLRKLIFGKFSAEYFEVLLFIAEILAEHGQFASAQELLEPTNHMQAILFGETSQQVMATRALITSYACSAAKQAVSNDDDDSEDEGDDDEDDDDDDDGEDCE